MDSVSELEEDDQPYTTAAWADLALTLACSQQLSLDDNQSLAASTTGAFASRASHPGLPTNAPPLQVDAYAHPPTAQAHMPSVPSRQPNTGSPRASKNPSLLDTLRASLMWKAASTQSQATERLAPSAPPLPGSTTLPPRSQQAKRPRKKVAFTTSAMDTTTEGANEPNPLACPPAPKKARPATGRSARCTYPGCEHVADNRNDLKRHVKVHSPYVWLCPNPRCGANKPKLTPRKSQTPLSHHERPGLGWYSREDSFRRHCGIRLSGKPVPASEVSRSCVPWIRRDAAAAEKEFGLQKGLLTSARGLYYFMERYHARRYPTGPEGTQMWVQRTIKNGKLPVKPGRKPAPDGQ